MPKKRAFIPAKLQPWIDARARYRLTHCQVQMARELGMNPAKLGKIANHKQEPWKVPLPAFIEQCYARQFGRSTPEDTRSIEQRIDDARVKEAAKKAAKQLAADGLVADTETKAVAKSAPTSVETTATSPTLNPIRPASIEVR